jgi:hypothetical protein
MVPLFVSLVASANTNMIVGTQMIYGASDHVYNFTSDDVLTEQTRRFVDGLGGNQLKLRLAPLSTCSGYRLVCEPLPSSLKELAQVPSVANALSMPQITFYHLWVYSYSNNDFLKQNWTEEMEEAEYNETLEFATHLLRTFDGTNKTFMVGNWEGDWALMGASGCRKDGKFDMKCNPTQTVIDRMVAWARQRQRAIDDARKRVPHSTAKVLYYIEMNLGPEALAGKPGVTNDVLPVVNPDLVSYSSYSATNAYQTTNNVSQTDEDFHAVLDHVASKLPHKPSVMERLQIERRVFVGEYGTHLTDDLDIVRFTTRVTHAAVTWGAPWVLYWEFYDNDSTQPIVPRSGEDTALWHWFKSYYTTAAAFVAAHVAAHGAEPTVREFNTWAAAYFAEPAKGSCTFSEDVGYPRSGGYRSAASSSAECCDLCATNPGCAAGVFEEGVCYMKYSASHPEPGTGVACIREK